MSIKAQLRNFSTCLEENDLPVMKLLGLALLLRVVWVLLIPVIPVSDSHAYNIFALNIFEHGTFGWTAEEPHAFWPVGTSAFYALLYTIFGVTFWPIVVFNLLFTLGGIFFTMKVAQHFFNNTTAFFCGLILALWPTSVMFSSVLASELPFIFLTLGTLYFWIHPTLSPVAKCVLMGVLTGLAIYVRPLAILLPFIYGYSLWLYAGGFRKNLIMAISTVVIACLMVAPWSYRNYQLYGEVVIMSTNGGITLWMGNHEGTNGGYAPIPEDTKDLTDHERAKVLGDRAKQYIKDEPVEFIRRTLWKAYRLHSYETIGVTWNEKGLQERLGNWSILPLKAMTQVAWLAFVALTFVGFFFLFRQTSFILFFSHPMILPWLYYTTVHAIIVSQDRYHIPMVPYMAVMAGYAVYKGLNWKTADHS